MIEEFRPKQISNEQINRKAEKFLQGHPNYNSVPIGIEEIIEFGLKMDIIPLPGLKRMFKERGLDADACLSSDLSSIRVDQFISEQRENRYRFTLAHEIGHRILHCGLYEESSFDTSEEWATVIARIPAKTWDDFEKQADEFAGRLLVPHSVLEREFRYQQDEATELILEDYPGLDKISSHLYQDRVKNKIIETLADLFVVSETVVKIRLQKDHLIPYQRN